MINSAVSWLGLASWIGAVTVLLVDHVAKVAIPDDLVIGTLGVACTLVVVRAVLSLRSPGRDYHEGWLACRRSIEREIERETERETERERMAAPLP